MSLLRALSTLESNNDAVLLIPTNNGGLGLVIHQLGERTTVTLITQNSSEEVFQLLQNIN